jgi:5'-nucleotidase
MVDRSLRILLTNDDGIDAPGLAVMLDIARALSDDVWIVAPEGNQSGAGHRVTFARELRLERRSERAFAVHGGSPADCVTAGMTHVLERPADLVLSGVNNGQNLGDIVNYSGTAAGAREGAFQGALGIAMSQGVDYERTREITWNNSVRFGAGVVRALVAEVAADPGQRHSWFNVNFPFCPADEVSGVRVVAHQRFSRSPLRYYPSRNEGHFFVAIPETPLPLDPAHDFHVLHKDKAITVTPFSVRNTDEALATRLAGKLRLG